MYQVTTPPPRTRSQHPPPPPRTRSQHPLPPHPGPGHNTPSPLGPGHNTHPPRIRPGYNTLLLPPPRVRPGYNTPPPPGTMRRRAVRILLECILVGLFYRSINVVSKVPANDLSKWKKIPLTLILAYQLELAVM